MSLSKRKLMTGLFLAYIAVAVETAFYASVSPLLPDLEREFGLSASEAGLLVAAYPIGLLVGSIPAGLFAAAKGPRTATSLGLAMIAGSSAWFAVGGSVESLHAARAIQGIAGGLCWCGALAWVVAAAPPDRQARAIGGALGVAIVGVLIGPVIGALAAELGRLPVFLGVGVLTGALVFPVLALAPADRSPAPLSTIGRGLVGRATAAGAWMVVVTGVVIGAASVLAPLRLDELGAASAAVGAVFVVGGLLEGTGSPVVGHLTDRIGPWRPISISLLVTAALLGALSLGLPLVLAAALFALLFPAVGLTLTPATSVLIGAAGAAGVPPAAAFSLVNLAWAFGEGAGALGGPVLEQGTSQEAPYLLLAAVCAGTVAVSVTREARSGTS